MLDYCVVWIKVWNELDYVVCQIKVWNECQTVLCTGLRSGTGVNFVVRQIKGWNRFWNPVGWESCVLTLSPRSRSLID
jgi:hypothetical protein